MFRSVPFHFLSAFSVSVSGCYHVFPHKGLRGLLGSNPVFYSMGVGQGTSWMSRQLIAGPLLMAVAVSTRCQLHIRSNFGVQYLAQRYFGMCQEMWKGEFDWCQWFSEHKCKCLLPKPQDVHAYVSSVKYLMQLYRFRWENKLVMFREKIKVWVKTNMVMNHEVMNVIQVGYVV